MAFECITVAMGDGLAFANASSAYAAALLKPAVFRIAGSLPALTPNDNALYFMRSDFAEADDAMPASMSARTCPSFVIT